MAQIYVNSKFGDLETIKLRHILFPWSWSSNVQFQFTTLRLLRC